VDTRTAWDLTHQTQTYRGGKPKTIWGMELGNLMDYVTQSISRLGYSHGNKALVYLHVDGNNVTPQLVPIINNSFTVNGKTFKW
jgi:hypothetical protein